jgi:hypothetical protein
MDPIEYLILITVAITLFEVLNVVFSILNFTILIPLFGNNSMILPNEVSDFIIGLCNQIAAKLIPFYIIIITFYILMYMIYLFIINVIPPTGFLTIFIPIREILLKIPPLPALEKFGVIRLMDRIMEALYLKGFLIKFVKINGAVFDFSRENIKRVLILLVPSLEDKIDAYDRKNFNKEEKKEEKPEVVNEIHKKIEDDKNICIKQNTKMTTPDMSAGDKISNDFSNLFETINCESKSIGNYIRSNK